MSLWSIFQRSAGEAGTEGPRVASAPTSETTVQQARVRARRRLVGATVLVVTGIVGFPLIFETQPRPVPVDIPIDIPRPEQAPALTMPPRSPGLGPSRTEANPAGASAESGLNAPVAAAAASMNDPGVLEAPSPVAEAPTQKPDAELRSPPETTSRLPKESSQSPGKAAVATAPTAAAPAPVAPAEAARFVVQIGAFADAASARDTRLKAERLGFKTYTQVTQTSAGNRTRVRVGPLSSRAEADKVAERLKSAGLGGVVLTL